jgi:hypothetical protein
VESELQGPDSEFEWLMARVYNGNKFEIEVVQSGPETAVREEMKERNQ